MADIAQIGFAANTSGLDQALPALRALVPAAKAVETGANSAAAAVSNVGAAATGTATATTAAVRIINTASTGFSQQAANANKATDAYKKFADIQNQINKATGVTTQSPVGRVQDIAAYGQALDALRAKYDPLFAAGQEYKATLNDINMALRVGALNETQHAAAITDTKVAFTQQVNSLRGINEQYGAFNGSNAKTRAAYQGLSFDAKNLSYQLVDVSQGLISGQPLFQIFAQQAGQIGQVLATTGGGAKSLFKEIGSAIAGFLTPIRLAAAGVIALAAAMYIAATSTLTTSKALDDLSKSTDVSLAKLHGLQQAMSLKGISTDEFAAGMTQFSASVDEAQHNMGSLNGLMISTGKSAKDFQGYLSAVADIVAQTSSGVQKRNLLEAAGLPTTQAWVRFMSQGGDAIKKATANSVEFNDAAEKNLIQKARDFDDAWNKATTNVANYFKSIVIDNLDWVTKVGQIIELAIKLKMITNQALSPVLPTKPAGSLDPTSKGFIGPIGPAAGDKGFIGPVPAASDGTKPAPQPQTQAQLLAANQRAQQRISILGDLATVEQQAAAKQLELNAAGLQGVGVNDNMAKKIVLATTAQAEQTRVNQQAQAGIFNLGAAQKAASDTLQHWIDQGLVDKNNVEQMAAAHLVLARNIKATSDAAAVAAAPLQQLKQLELDGANFAKSLDTAATGALNNMVQPIQDMMNGVTGLSAGFKNLGVVVLQAIQQMIIKMLIITPIAKALQAVMGGMFGDLFGGATTVAGAVGPTSLGGAPLVANALGGVYNSPSLSSFSGMTVTQPTLFKFASGAGLMGEAGAEGILPLKRGPSGALGVQMFGQQASNDNSATHVTYAPSYTLGGNVTQDDLAQVKKAQEQDRQAFASNTIDVIKNMRKHNVRV